VENRPRRVRTPGAVILALAIEQYSDNKGWHWTVDVERPGREGAFSRTWDAKGSLPADRAEDLIAWVAKTVTNSLIVWGGIQEVAQLDV
jgi:hypothetical protein